jgi:preprotein translocase subunit SecE
VKDSAAAKPAKSGSTGSSTPSRAGGFGAFLGNLFRVERYKPLQGRIARRATTAGLAVAVILGLVQVFYALDDLAPLTRYAIVLSIGAAIGWFIYRAVEFPPFVEFLIATEAEMNKVSWTTRDELRRATIVVLVTVAFMAVFLFGVDFLWQLLLRLLGVLRFGDTRDLGSTA